MGILSASQGTVSLGSLILGRFDFHMYFMFYSSKPVSGVAPVVTMSPIPPFHPKEPPQGGHSLCVSMRTTWTAQFHSRY